VERTWQHRARVHLRWDTVWKTLDETLRMMLRKRRDIGRCRRMLLKMLRRRLLLDVGSLWRLTSAAVWNQIVIVYSNGLTVRRRSTIATGATRTPRWLLLLLLLLLLLPPLPLKHLLVMYYRLMTIRTRKLRRMMIGRSERRRGFRIESFAVLGVLLLWDVIVRFLPAAGRDSVDGAAIIDHHILQRGQTVLATYRIVSQMDGSVDLRASIVRVTDPAPEAGLAQLSRTREGVRRSIEGWHGATDHHRIVTGSRLICVSVISLIFHRH
jgi:hypothetical protein